MCAARNWTQDLDIRQCILSTEVTVLTYSSIKANVSSDGYPVLTQQMYHRLSKREADKPDSEK